MAWKTVERCEAKLLLSNILLRIWIARDESDDTERPVNRAPTSTTTVFVSGYVAANVSAEMTDPCCLVNWLMLE